MTACRHCAEAITRCDCGADGGPHWVDARNSRHCAAGQHHEPQPTEDTMTAAIVCYAKCTPCQFGEHPNEAHTWMESEDIEHEGRPSPKSEADWAALAAEQPCGCHCLRAQPSPDAADERKATP